MYFIRQRLAHVTYYVELVEAETEDEARTKDTEYIGYYDADYDEAPFTERYVGPFATRDEATESDDAWTEG